MMTKKNKKQRKSSQRLFVVSAGEVLRYRKVSTARKIQWLEEMQRIFFASMTPKLFKRWEKLRKMGY